MTTHVPPSDAPTAPIVRPAADGAAVPAAPAFPPERPDDAFHLVSSLPFILLHFTPLLIIFTGWSWRAAALGVVLYVARMFFITAGYHRYFAHRSYKLARVPQFLMALGGTTAVQKGPLWWASHHRDHHRYSDTERDIHSPQKGFLWSHVTWILCERHAETKLDRIKDFAKYPELRFLNTYDWVGGVVLAVVSYLILGWQGVVIGFLCSTILLWHGTFTINSLSHVFGRRRYVTDDTSRNNGLLAVITLGEGWHNNHHYYPSSARQGFFWWEFDPSYYVLKGLSYVGIVKDLKTPPEWALRTSRVKDGNFDIGMFRAHWNKATRAVVAASGQLSDRVHERRVHAGESLAERRHLIEDGLSTKKDALESFVRGSLESAEDLAKYTKRSQRGFDPTD